MDDEMLLVKFPKEVKELFSIKTLKIFIISLIFMFTALHVISLNLNTIIIKHYNGHECF